MNQITLRQIPKPLESRLREFAKESGESINKSAIALLKMALGLDRERRRRRDLAFLVGSWTKEEAVEFESNARMFEHLDPEVWQ